jgi:glycogen debranching enzyme
MLYQRIIPEKRLFFTGETVKFELDPCGIFCKGRPVLRTNIGGGRLKTIEIIEKNKSNRHPKGNDWHDFNMQKNADGTYSILLALTEPGIFEAKCCFIPEDGSAVLWAEGENFKIKVSSNVNSCSNGIYSCFVRQWGKWMHLPHSPEQPDLSTLDKEGFVAIPPSGTFRSVIAGLDHIFDTLNCRILQLLPIHPTPVSYGRMGRYGSPFAATDYFAVDPALAEFDTAVTPLDQFIELIDAVHVRNGRIFMDLPVNHTGWSSKLQNEHPDYFIRKKNGEFVSPGAWGIVWADLCQLDYNNPHVHDFMAEVFLFWCRHGVDGCRCDAGYMVPVEAWNYITAKVRKEYPDTTFLLEGLGGPLYIQEELLENTGLDWGYSELFQNYTRDQISAYYPYVNSSSHRGSTLVNFAETHDNTRLATEGKVFAKLRFLVNALLSVNGSFGFANGAEYFACEKIDVHGCSALNFGAVDNLCSLIGKLNILLSSHPAFACNADVKLIQHGPGNVVAALRSNGNSSPLLILFNLDCQNKSWVHFPSQIANTARDLLTGKICCFNMTDNSNVCCELEAGEALCLAFDDFEIPAHLPDCSKLQAAAMAQNAAMNFVSFAHAAEADGEFLCADPVKFTESVSNSTPAPVTSWYYPQDINRVVMLPHQDLLLLRSKVPFSAELHNNDENICRIHSLRENNGNYFALLRLPHKRLNYPENITLNFTAFENKKVSKVTGTIRLLADSDKRMIKLCQNWHASADSFAFGSNIYSSYAMFNAQWGKINSKYDAILAVNNNPDFPDNRYVMFTRCRAWIVLDDYSQELTEKTLESFCTHPGNRAKWTFSVPDGHGGECGLSVEFRMASDLDCIELKFHRQINSRNISPQAKLILRPDLEDRINHSLTRACDGSEYLFRQAVKIFPDGFEFQPASRKLKISVSSGKFHSEPEWQYMVDLPQERYYGMNDKTDLFSPGYFSIPLNPDENVILTASAAINDTHVPQYPPAVYPKTSSPLELATDSLSRFVVKRDGLSTVIAGFPWFLDWGRDTFIVLRGLLKFPEFQQKVADIIRRFAAFEKNGTIPNMICGENDSNRDTSDAPLYLIIAVRDYIAETGNIKFLETDCGGRTLHDILCSIAKNYTQGTPNGIYMDKESCLIFSPSHFSWMDTNYPAGTPREGYPVEIQALWFAALEFLGEHDIARKVQESIEKLYFINNTVSDCLHCKSGTSAKLAIPDDHLRCNILTAVTFGAVRTREKQLKIMQETEKLLIPGAVRTLDDSDVVYALPICHDGNLLNAPTHPYQGKYCGPEDTSRKIAYHNGTAWCWPFPSYCEALYIIGGEKSRKRALDLLMSAADRMESGISGEIPEVLDGDTPHNSGGCPAQAWSVSEFYRVLKILNRKDT